MFQLTAGNYARRAVRRHLWLFQKFGDFILGGVDGTVSERGELTEANVIRN